MGAEGTRGEALLVIDMINSCCAKRCERPRLRIGFSKIRRMAVRLERFVRKYRGKGGLVVFVSCVPWTEEFLPENIRRLYSESPKANFYSSDTSGFPEKFYSVSPKRRERVFLKATYDAFSNKALSRFLKKRGVSRLLISGVFSDGCVNATVNGAFSAGFSMRILGDLVETTDEPERQKLQDLLKKRNWPSLYGPVIDSSDA